MDIGSKRTNSRAEHSPIGCPANEKTAVIRPFPVFIRVQMILKANTLADHFFGAVWVEWMPKTFTGMSLPFTFTVSISFMSTR